MERQIKTHTIVAGIGLFLIVVVVAIVLLQDSIATTSPHGAVPTGRRHAEYGVIFASQAADVIEVRRRQGFSSSRRSLWEGIRKRVGVQIDLPVVRSVYLKIGIHQMEWSMGGRKSGWLYFHNLTDHVKDWEFAPFKRVRLENIKDSDFGGPFYTALTPGWTNALDGDPSGEAFRVREGELYLARHSYDANIAYVIELTRQNDGLLQTHSSKSTSPGSCGSAVPSPRPSTRVVDR